MASMVPLKCLIFLCLLHLCVQSIQGVNTAVLAKMIQYFYDNIQLKTEKTQEDAQYALAISVPPDHCTKEGSDIQTVFPQKDAELVKEKLKNGEKCFFCTPSNVIAARPDLKTKEHPEHILLYPLNKSPMDELLKKADQDSCVVFYSFNSPCMKTCMKSNDNIFSGLSNWINKRKEGMNAFVFQKIWKKDLKKKDLEEEFLKINAVVPLYRCKISDKMKCVKCVENKVLDPFCLSA